MNFQSEVISQSWLNVFVITYCLIEFFFRFWMKGKVHFSNLFHAFLKTSFPGIAFTRPDLSSSRRPLASLAHILSISDSGWFRLRNSESTTRALSSTGSDTASSISCFVFMYSPLSDVAYLAQRKAKPRELASVGLSDGLDRSRSNSILSIESVDSFAPFAPVSARTASKNRRKYFFLHSVRPFSPSPSNCASAVTTSEEPCTHTRALASMARDNASVFFAGSPMAFAPSISPTLRR